MIWVEQQQWNRKLLFLMKLELCYWEKRHLALKFDLKAIWYMGVKTFWKCFKILKLWFNFLFEKLKLTIFYLFFFFFQTIKGLRIPSVNNSIEQCGIISYCQPNSVWALRSRECIRTTVEVLLWNFFWFIIIINYNYCLSWFIADLQLNTTPKDTIQFLR